MITFTDDRADGPHCADGLSSAPRPVSLSALTSGEDAVQPGGKRLGIDLSPLSGIRASLQVVVGQVPTTVGDLLGFQDRQVVVLNRMVGDPVDLVLNGAVVARGHLVAVDGNFGVRICDVPRGSEI